MCVAASEGEEESATYRLRTSPPWLDAAAQSKGSILELLNFLVLSKGSIFELLNILVLLMRSIFELLNFLILLTQYFRAARCSSPRALNWWFCYGGIEGVGSFSDIGGFGGG